MNFLLFVASDRISAYDHILVTEIPDKGRILTAMSVFWFERFGPNHLVAFEFGHDADGNLVLADEVFTPDSSRYWPADGYQPGRVQPSFDKQFVRDWLTSPESGWDRASDTSPPPLPADVVEATRARYVEAYERITGRTFADWLA